MKIRNLVTAVALATLSVGAFAQAHTYRFQQRGPEGRIEIEHRLEKQGARIWRKLRAGQLTELQARALRADDERVRDEMRTRESSHFGHLTPTDLVVLNRQLDNINRRIGT
jgi:hypothetical protein